VRNVKGSYFQRTIEFIGRPLTSFFRSAGATIRLICPATAWDRSCTGGHPTLAGPLKDYLEISYWPVPSSVGRAHELLAYKLVEGFAEEGAGKWDVDEKDRNGVCDLWGNAAEIGETEPFFAILIAI
jgi:hypothetical protein